MEQVDNRRHIVDSANGREDAAVNNGSSIVRPSLFHAPLSTIRYPAAIFVLFLFAIYWPVFLGYRFFWEDFFIQEYPIREFCFYMVRFQHVLPFWNPYSWPWSPLMADAQSGFWYPTNLLQIALTWLISPHAIHLPVLMPEMMTLFHLPLAALGVFVLLRKEFRVTGISAVMAGLCWGFGVRMVAEQNHSMQIIQLALLPWETLLLMRVWNSWRHAIGLGLLFGVSFFAGQPQTFYFFAIFFTCFTFAEVLARKREGREWQAILKPFQWFALSMAITVGIASVQLLPTLELAGQSARSHLSYQDAGSTAIQLGHFIDFFVPKFYGEYPGFSIPKSDVVNTHFWYWEATFYWSALAEILALFAIVSLWKRRTSGDPRTRYLVFAVSFSLVALAFGMGPNLHVQWIFWKFIPFFDRLRAPNRMIWLLWFLGTLYAGVGLDVFFQKHKQNSLEKYKRFFFWSCFVFVLFSTLSVCGIFDLVFPPHVIRRGLSQLTMPSLIVALFVSAYFYLVLHRKIPTRIIIPLAVLLIVCDLYFWDSGWHRNTFSREMETARDAANPALVAFFRLHSQDHAKLLWTHHSPIRMEANLGMILRLPIEDAIDSETLKDLNPMRMVRMVPPISNLRRRIEIMGIKEQITDSENVEPFPNALPYLKLYHRWVIPASDEAAEHIYTDSLFDFQKTILLEHLPSFPNQVDQAGDTVTLNHFSENRIGIQTRSAVPSILLINDLYYSAWKAYVDERETTILRGFTSLLAVPLTAGAHRIELRYDSAAFNLGWKVTVGTLSICILALFIGKKQKDPTA